MVSAVILLFTVSTLVAHAVAIPTKEFIVQHACKGQTLCDVKPDNYPQEMVDHIMKHNQHYLRRMKRHTNNAIAMNNCVSSTETKRYYTKEYLDKLSGLMIHSILIPQTITHVTCKVGNSKCLGALGEELQATCKSVETPVEIWALDGEKKLTNETIYVPTHCACSK